MRMDLLSLVTAELLLFMSVSCHSRELTRAHSHNMSAIVRFVVFRAVTMKNAVYWDMMTPYVSRKNVLAAN
jgi:hypothetical protein